MPTAPARRRAATSPAAMLAARRWGGILWLTASALSRAMGAPCVQSPSGKMLCCAPDDLQCLEKVQKAHEAPPSSPPPVVVEPPRPGLLGSMHTFANVSVWDGISPYDVAVVGVPFGLEAGYEAPGMQLVRREASLIPPYSRTYGASVGSVRVVDGQDLLATGADRGRELEMAALHFFRTMRPAVFLGGDQSITVPLLRAAKASLGTFALVHIDKDLATGSGTREQSLNAETALFWGAASGLFDTRHSLHVAARGNLHTQRVDLIDQELGFQTLGAEEVAVLGLGGVVEKIRERLARRDGTFMPAYLSVDLDALDPTYFPSGREVGGLSVKELRALLAALRPFCRVVAADLRSVAPLSDPAVVRVAAAVAHDMVLLAGHQPGSMVTAPPLRHEGDL